MNNDFPRIVTLLRKERGLSQKQAALELGVSQALLSHYEKGIRECGLDFLCRIADYYNVSCDYLLGRSADRTGASISIDVDTGVGPSQDSHRTNALLAMNSKLIFNSMNVVFDLLERIDSKGLSAEVSSYFMVTVYKMVRAIYSANVKNPQAMFSVIPELYSGISSALQTVLETNIGGISSGRPAAGYEGVNHGSAVSLSPDIISRTYPELAPSLYNLIRETEDKMKSIL